MSTSSGQTLHHRSYTDLGGCKMAVKLMEDYTHLLPGLNANGNEIIEQLT